MVFTAAVSEYTMPASTVQQPQTAVAFYTAVWFSVQQQNNLFITMINLCQFSTSERAEKTKKELEKFVK